MICSWSMFPENSPILWSILKQMEMEMFSFKNKWLHVLCDRQPSPGEFGMQSRGGLGPAWCQLGQLGLMLGSLGEEPFSSMRKERYPNRLHVRSQNPYPALRPSEIGRTTTEGMWCVWSVGLGCFSKNYSGIWFLFISNIFLCYWLWISITIWIFNVKKEGLGDLGKM